MSRGGVLAGLLLLIAVGCGSSEAPPSPAPATANVAAETETAPPAQPTESPSSVGEATFESAALGVTKRYRFYLPPGYQTDADRRYPVVYLLHGLGGSEDNWVDIGIQKTADQVGLDAIVVMPDGDDGFYVNAATPADYDACMKGRRPFGRASRMSTYCVKSARYEDYIVNDLIAHVDATYRTAASRDKRAIAGLSMGGFGALMLSMRHADLFSIAVSHAGVASLLYAGSDPYDPAKARLSPGKPDWVNKGNEFGAHFLKLFGDKPDFWKSHDPTTLAAKLEPGALALYLDCGTLDEFRLYLGAQMMHDLLDSKKIPHDFELVEGGRHDGEFWSSRLDDGLTFIKTRLQ